MGATQQINDTSSTSRQISLTDFEFSYPIGKGGFGNVWKATHKRSKQPLALKIMLKARVISKRSASSVEN